jgi:RHS repeat-associated protein
MLAPTERAPNRPSPLPLPSALLAAEPGPAVMADDPCEAAFASADPTGPRKYYRARYYDPKVGRFISEDPIRWEGGINLYAYVDNNPVRFLDPMGRAPVTGLDPYDLWIDYDDARRTFENKPDWTRDRERHCYFQCRSFRRRIQNPFIGPWTLGTAPGYEGIRLLVKLARGDFNNMSGDAAADLNGMFGGYMFWKSCEEICTTAWCRRRQ